MDFDSSYISEEALHTKNNIAKKIAEEIGS